MPALTSELFRLDPLTGCKNFLGFLEILSTYPPPKVTTDRLNLLDRYRINDTLFSAILFADMNDLRFLNNTKGRLYGDSVLRWMGILLQEESKSEVYRLGGDEFAILLKLETRESHLELADRIQKRMEREASRLGFPGTAAEIALIFLDQTPTRLDTLLINMGEAAATLKNSPDYHFRIFNEAEFKIHSPASETPGMSNGSDFAFEVRWLAIKNIDQILEMGRLLDATQQEAFTDAISNLPNMKAALVSLDQMLEIAQANQSPYSIMMIDGDNIRIYNNINYAAGDTMIRDMGAVFKKNLRPSDFVARWRTGDEFLVILPDTPIEGAKIIGERFRLAIKEASKDWRFPTSISIGIASYPTHGKDINILIDKAEAANKRAKDQGKDQVVVAE
jgi:diguanylate cyclase (GGDEF)-like protein